LIPREVLGAVKAPTVAADEAKNARAEYLGTIIVVQVLNLFVRIRATAVRDRRFIHFVLSEVISMNCE